MKTLDQIKSDVAKRCQQFDRCAPSYLTIGEADVLLAALRAAEAERDQAKSLVEQLAEVLEQLRDLQNGCPLPKYLKEWTAAMKAAGAALAAAGERG